MTLSLTPLKFSTSQLLFFSITCIRIYVYTLVYICLLPACLSGPSIYLSHAKARRRYLWGACLNTPSGIHYPIHSNKVHVYFSLCAESTQLKCVLRIHTMCSIGLIHKNKVCFSHTLQYML